VKGALEEHNAWLASCVIRAEMPHFLDTEEPCLAVDATNDRTCCLPLLHPGPHSWQRVK
jgi:hypothetical protein